MFKIYDGREQFYQWDIDRKLIVYDEGITEVHFCNKTDDCSLVCETYKENGLTLVNVPNILLQDDWRINVYAYTKNYTKFSKTFDVLKRSKPESYVYTETEVLSFDVLMGRMDKVEDNIGKAVADYLVDNPIDAELLTGYATEKYVNDAIAVIELTPGEKGEQGEKGEPGKDGAPGKDGYTPIKGIDYFDGRNGKDGKDGYVPIKGVDYFDGAPGRAGADGKDGADGYTPVKGIDYFDGKDGKDGYTPIKGVDYFDGEPGAKGAKGEDGEPGVGIESMRHISTNGLVKTYCITFTNGNTQHIDITNGAPGKDGKDGTDYVLTAADKQEIANMAIELMPVAEGGLY